MSYLESVHEAMAETRHIKEVMFQAALPPEDSDVWVPRAKLIRERSLKVDIVGEEGLVWIKVIARNAKALRHDMAGLEEDEGDLSESSDDDDDDEEEEGHAAGMLSNDFNELPIFKKARNYLQSAEAHQIHFKKPVVVFAFTRIQADQDVFVQRIMDRLSELGVLVYTQSDNQSLHDAYSVALQGINISNLTTPTLNMDVSSALAVLSEMTHHPCAPDAVDGEALQIQAEREQVSPALPELKRILSGKELCIVQSAYDRLVSIVNIVGGPREQARFRYLFRDKLQEDVEYDSSLWNGLPPMRVRVMPDAMSERFRKLLEPPPRKAKLNNGRKIRSRFSEFHAIIFGSGDHYKMTTVTAIQWMQNALMDAGMTENSIICHEPRSLAEQKMHRYRDSDDSL